MMMMINTVDNQSNGIFRLGHRIATTTTADATNPMYSSVFVNPDPLKNDSDVSYSLPVSRKRSRDYESVCNVSGDLNGNWNIPVTFFGEDVSSQIRQQQLEIDQFVVRHTEKVTREIEERRRRNSMKLISAMEEGITQRLKAKEHEIANMGKLNHALEDKLNSLCIENQIWRELAQTNEATANTLRNNLNQVLEQVINEDHMTAGEESAVVVPAAVADDAQSCCESNTNELVLTEQDSVGSNMKRLCKRCGEAESCVLLLPCRHLCLCTLCVSCVDICPICKSAKNISVHVHLS